MSKKKHKKQESKDVNQQQDLVQLRSYPAPWKGELVLACTKCIRKLKKDKSDVANIRKWLKSRSKQDDGPTVRVIGVNCVKMCPKGAVTIATQQQLGHSPAQVSIVRSEADLEALYARLSGPTAA